jgi:hypothetical protein
MIFTSNFSTTGQLMFIILKLVNKRWSRGTHASRLLFL